MVAVVAALFGFFVWPGTGSFVSIFSLGLLSASSDPLLDTVRYYDLSNVQGTARGWEREERILVCVPLRDAEAHLNMMFSHLHNLTYPHHLIDLAFLVSDSKDRTMEVLVEKLEALQAHEDPKQPYGEIQIIEKDFGQKVNQDVESRHGFAAQAGRRKLMAQARNWLLSAALRPYHSWVYWRDVDVETAPFTILEDLMRHNKDIIVPSKYHDESRFGTIHDGRLMCFQMCGAPSPTGWVASSRTISTLGRSRRRPWPWQTRSTRTPLSSRVMPSTPRGDLTLLICAIPTATPTWKWRLTEWVVSVFWPKPRSSERAAISRPLVSRSTPKPRGSERYGPLYMVGAGFASC